MNNCQHPPARLYSWFAYNRETGKDDILCVGCCECGEVLKGNAGEDVTPDSEQSD